MKKEEKIEKFAEIMRKVFSNDEFFKQFNRKNLYLDSEIAARRIYEICEGVTYDTQQKVYDKYETNYLYFLTKFEFSFICQYCLKYILGKREIEDDYLDYDDQ